MRHIRVGFPNDGSEQGGKHDEEVYRVYRNRRRSRNRLMELAEINERVRVNINSRTDGLRCVQRFIFYSFARDIVVLRRINELLRAAASTHRNEWSPVFEHRSNHTIRCVTEKSLRSENEVVDNLENDCIAGTRLLRPIRSFLQLPLAG